jgi:Spy/CpxP family protein refolding chaperone
MKKFTRVLLTLSMVALLTSPLMAADEKAEKKKGNKRKRPAVSIPTRLPKSVVLNEEQPAKVKALQSEFAGKFTDIGTKSAGVYSPEQRKARAKAFQEARKSGKKRQELAAAADAAAKVTDEQKKQITEIRKEQRKLTQEFQTKLREILTAEQKDQLKEAAKKRKAAGGKKKKKKKTDK